MMKPISAECLEYLKSEYAQPHRFYHTWEHVEELKEWCAGCEKRDILWTAAMFHDAVYEIGAPDNEQRSAELLVSMLPKSPDRDEAVACIMFCKEPFAPSESTQAMFTDFDYAILGADRPQYMRYTQGVTAEYCTKYPLVDVQRGRKKFLEGLLKQGRLFRTGWVERFLGSRARQNITAELGYLNALFDAGPT